MRPEPAPPAGGYLLGLLADGAAAFVPRTRVHRLLGVPAAEAAGVSYLPPLPPVGFQYAAWGPGSGSGAPGHAPSAPPGGPPPRAELHSPPSAAVEAWDGGDAAAPSLPSASSPAPARAAPRPGPALPPAAAAPRPRPPEVRGADATPPVSLPSVPGAPRPADAPAAPWIAAGGTTPVRRGDTRPPPSIAAPADAGPAQPRSADRAPEATSAPPARTVGVTIPGMSGPREILAALAQRQASAAAADPGLPRTPVAGPAGPTRTEAPGTEPDAPRAAPVAHLRAAPRVEGGGEAEAHVPAPPPAPRRSSASPRLAAPEATGRTAAGGGAAVEQLRRATAQRARQSAPPPEQAPAVQPVPASPLVQQQQQQPVVVVQAAGPESLAPRAFLASSLLRGSHLRVLR